jgi:hypothetical protein
MRLPRAVILLTALILPAIGRTAGAPDVRFELHATGTDFPAGGPVILRWSLDNRSSQPVAVLAGVESPARMDADPITLDIQIAGGRHRTVALIGKRTASSPVVRILAPGERLDQDFDLTAFAAINGVVLETGEITVRATYDSADPASLPEAVRPFALVGRLTAPPLRMTLRPAP